VTFELPDLDLGRLSPAGLDTLTTIVGFGVSTDASMPILEHAGGSANGAPLVTLWSPATRGGPWRFGRRCAKVVVWRRFRDGPCWTRTSDLGIKSPAEQAAPCCKKRKEAAKRRKRRFSELQRTAGYGDAPVLSFLLALAV
jgi:hypothetical protein